MADGSTSASRRDAELARERLADWLWRSACEPCGHGESVVARREHDGRAWVAYPEIAGYYLVFLARHGADHGPARIRAAAIARWLGAWSASDGTTRPRLHGGELTPDWRNRLHFLFDDAMLLRGLAAAGAAGVLEREDAERLGDALWQRVLALRDDHGCLRAVRGHGEVPPRWSTERGPFLFKALAALRRSARVLPAPSAIQPASDELGRVLHPMLDRPLHPDCTHAALYALEGAVLFAADGLDLGPRHDLTACLELWPRAEPNQAARHDVVAQWLRLALLAGLTPDHPAATTAVRALCAAIDDDGGMPFAPAPGDIRANTWCALFAWQALDWWLRRAQSPLEEEREWLI